MAKAPRTLTYEDSGVDRAKADRLVEGIRKLTRVTGSLPIQKNLRSSFGGYAAVYAVAKDQWIAATTDGVGTKLKLAFEAKAHATIGQDLVAMSVNDLICVGAKPAFFLDYFATSKLDRGVGETVIGGIAKACFEAGCLLVGGETAEMPGIYTPGEYDLAGFAVGTLKPADLLPLKSVKPGDRLIGIASSGFHSNGYSLLRKIIDQPGMKNRTKIVRQLLEPTRLYPAAVAPVLKFIKGAAHITGSGFLNVPRISEKVNYEISLPPLAERAPVFTWLQNLGVVRFEEAAQTFNMGIGMVLCVAEKDAAKVLKLVRKSGFPAWDIGQTTRARAGVPLVSVTAEEGSVELRYE